MVNIQWKSIQFEPIYLVGCYVVFHCACVIGFVLASVVKINLYRLRVKCESYDNCTQNYSSFMNGFHSPFYFCQEITNINSKIVELREIWSPCFFDVLVSYNYSKLNCYDTRSNCLYFVVWFEGIVEWKKLFHYMLENCTSWGDMHIGIVLLTHSLAAEIIGRERVRAVGDIFVSLKEYRKILDAIKKNTQEYRRMQNCALLRRTQI